MPTSTTATTPMAGHGPRVWAGWALLLGGALSFIASFLPFSRITWPGLIYPPATETIIPAQTLLTSTGLTPSATLANSVCGALLLLGAPGAIAALGAAALAARRWAAGWLGFAAGFPLVILGIAYTLINAAFALTPTSPTIPGVSHTLDVGAFLMALGNLLALVGIILVPRIRLTAEQAPQR